MKYRIKIVTFKNGRQSFHAQVKKYFRWDGLNFDGEAGWAYDGECDTREKALQRIDKHFEGNTEIKSTAYEGISERSCYLRWKERLNQS